MTGSGKVAAAARSRPISPLSASYQDDGLVIIALAFCDTWGLTSARQLQPSGWLQVVIVATVFSVCWLALIDRRDGWLAAAVASSAPALPDAVMSRRHGLVRRSAAYGALSAVLALMESAGVVSSSLLAILPALMVAQGVWCLGRAARVRTWEHQGESELLVRSGWRRSRASGYFIRPAP